MKKITFLYLWIEENRFRYNMKDILVQICQNLKDSVDAKTQATSQNYFKEKIKFYGDTVGQQNKTSKKTVMSRTSLRYAIEKMPLDVRMIAMVK